MLGLVFYVWVGIFSLATIAWFWRYTKRHLPPGCRREPVCTRRPGVDRRQLVVVDREDGPRDRCCGPVVDRWRFDIRILGDSTFQLRAERSEIGSGRIYTITYQATDAHGNAALASAMTTVPTQGL